MPRHDLTTSLPQSALPYFEQSLAEGRVHASPRAYFEVRQAALDEGAAVIQLWFVHNDGQRPAQLWDELVVAPALPEQLAALLGQLKQAGVLPSTDLIARTPATREPLQIPMFQYHPQRFRAVNPVAKTMAQAASSVGKTAFTEDSMRQAMTAWTEARNERTVRSPLRLLLQHDTRMERQVASAALFLEEFTAHGRQIFDFPPKLAAAFRQSDVEDVPLSAIKLPFTAFYLHFGEQSDLETAPGWHPDGAYVALLGEPGERQVLQFCLTSAPKDQLTYEDWVTNTEPFYIQAFPDELWAVGVGESVDRVLSDKMAQLSAERSQAASGQSIVAQGLQELATEGEDVSGVVDVTGRNAAREAASLPALHHAWREMLNLVINAIAYLTSYREDIRDSQWPANAPSALLDAAMHGTPKQRQRSRSKLAALGYSAVHLCGRRFEEMLTNDEPQGGTADPTSKKPTWVRGTWVWQAHGPQWSQRRLQWRVPHVRNKGEGDNPTSHLYLVS